MGKGVPHLCTYYINLQLKGYSNTDWGLNLDNQ